MDGMTYAFISRFSSPKSSNSALKKSDPPPRAARWSSSAPRRRLLRKELVAALGTVQRTPTAPEVRLCRWLSTMPSAWDRLRWRDPIEGAFPFAVRARRCAPAGGHRPCGDQQGRTRSGERALRRGNHLASIVQRSSTFHHYGRSSGPVCWSLVGYDGGFARCLASGRRSISRNKPVSDAACGLRHHRPRCLDLARRHRSASV